MSFRINNVMFGGYLTDNAELLKTAMDESWTHFFLGVSRIPFKGEETSESDFIACVAFRSQAEVICKYTKKGSPLIVSGELQNRQYLDKAGIKKYISEIIVKEVTLVDKKG